MEKNRDARFPDVNSFVKAVTSRSLATAPTVAAVRPTAPPSPAVAPTERIDRQHRSMVPFFAALGVAAVLSAGFAYWKTRDRRPETDTSTSTSTSTSTKTPSNTNTPSETPAAKAEPKVEESPKTAAQEPKAAADDAKAAAKEAPRAPKASDTAKASAKEAALAPEAARDLDEAEAALTADKPGDALRLAQHSLYAQKSSRAYAIIVRARCAQGDLGNAKAALAHVSARDRSTVVRACGKLGVELH
jgi:hypothetical protein